MIDTTYALHGLLSFFGYGFAGLAALFIGAAVVDALSGVPTFAGWVGSPKRGEARKGANPLTHPIFDVEVTR